MKKTYKSITTFIVLLNMLMMDMSAQLSGVVTIDSGSPASTTNYQTFTALASTLNASGINGPLTVNVVALSGPYVEQPSFGVIAGVSATNTITINGNGNVLTFSATALTSGWTLNLNGSDYMSFNNMTIVGTSSTIAFACVLNSGADYNTFTACTFSCPTFASAANQYAVMINGNNSGSQNNSNISANYTTFKSCSMIGGYYNVYMYNPTSPPYSTNNTFDHCTMRDTYATGLYSFWSVNLTITHCTFERPTRTNGTTINGMQLLHSQNAMVENNLIERMFDAQQTITNQFNGINLQSSSGVAGTGKYNTIRNNVIRDIKSNGPAYGINGSAPGAADGYIHHNTISFDHHGSTATGSTIGIFLSGANGYLTDIKNNCISITRGGTGGKFCYYANTGGNSTVNNNNYYMNAPAGTINYIGYYNGVACSNLAVLQTQGIDANSISTDPMFTSLPSNVIPTSAMMNDIGMPVGIVTDHLDFNRSGSTPDIGAYEFLSNNCTGVSTTTAITAPGQAICFGETASLLLNGATSDLGITYQWLSSANSSTGPWTVIAGANTAAYTTPAITANVYYGLEVKCTLSAATTTVATLVNLAATTTSTIPYNESFEGVTKTNKLPNCSWSASGLAGSCLTYTGTIITSPNLGRAPRTGNKFASFFVLPYGDKYFYTNGIQLNAGVTYSASVWFQTEPGNAYTNWTDLSILYGPTQSTTGLVSIASTNGPAVSIGYKSLSGTFTVTTSGIYYVTIKGASISTPSFHQYLNWDDLSVIIPCSLNTPSMTISASANTICATQSVVITAGGADSFLWNNTGATTKAITSYPLSSVAYSVNGTSTLTGCSSAITQYVVVNPLPNVLAHATGSGTLCAGSSVNISALGNAVTYTWSTGSSNPFINVAPPASTSYTLSGTSSKGCVSKSVLPISVAALPTINATNSSTNIMCAGDSQILTATGALTYQWIASPSGLVLSGASVNVNPAITTTYTVTGTDVAGCSGKVILTQNVSECSGLDQIPGSLIKMYPNPTAGEITVELHNSSLKTVEVMDLTGRVISTYSSFSDVLKIDLHGLSKGMYHVKIRSNDLVEVLKVVKQ
jgi:hypothetical protein